MRNILGVDIGGTKCAVTYGRQDGAEIEIMDKLSFATTSCAETISNIKSSIHALMERHALNAGNTYSIGISCGGPLDSATGVVMSPPNLPGWDNIPIVPPVNPTFELVELDAHTRNAIASQGNVFANKLMLQMNQQVPDANLMISPMSLQYALGMLSNGCSETALKEITDAMGMKDYSLDMLNSFFYNLTQTLAKEDKDFTLKLANAIWIQENFEVGKDFIQNNKALFDADVNDIDFTQADKAKKTINEWAEKATNGTIKELSPWPSAYTVGEKRSVAPVICIPHIYDTAHSTVRVKTTTA